MKKPTNMWKALALNQQDGCFSSSSDTIEGKWNWGPRGLLPILKSSDFHGKLYAVYFSSTGKRLENLNEQQIIYVDSSGAKPTGWMFDVPSSALFRTPERVCGAGDQGGIC